MASKRKRMLDLIAAKERHGEDGHLNVYVRDQESYITNYGKHNRLLVFWNPANELYEIREDRKWGLPDSTEKDRQRALKYDRRPHSKNCRFRYVESEEDGDSIWHIYKEV